MSHPLRPLFEPRSVAVVGVSADPEKRGHQVVAALRASGFPGDVYPVNPRGGEILGLRVHPALDELPGAPDLAYVALPATAAPDAVAACGERGIRAAIVPAVGFRESGPEGAELEARLLRAARETGIRVVGPNTSGLLNTHARLHMVGGEPLGPGGLAILAQSGNIALDLITAASARPIGVSVYVGPGNETDIGFHEYLDFLGSHEPTRAIVIYVEGVRDGRALYETALRVSPRVPIVVLKGGGSVRGEEAARSHTGAVAGSHEVFVALARQAGMTVVERTDELLAVAETLATQPVPAGSRASDDDRGIVILSDGGGHATVAADRLAEAGVPLTRLAEPTRARLRGLLGPSAAVGNPVDVAGATDRAPTTFVRALEAVIGDRACAGVLLLGLFGGYAIRFAPRLAGEEAETAGALARIAREAGVPLVVHSLYAARRPAALERLSELGVPVFGSLEIAARAMAALCERSGCLLPRPERAGAGPTEAVPASAAGRPSAAGGGPRLGAPARERWLPETEARALVERASVPLVPAILCRTSAAAAEAAGAIGGPCALKAISPHAPHKTEAGAVLLGVEGADRAAAGFERVVRSIGAWLRDRGLPEEVDGVLVSPMQPPPVAELLVGARRDPHFGPILTVGAGGIDVELVGDVAIRALPVESGEVERALKELALAWRLYGYRGRPGVDTGAIASMACALGRVLLETPELVELELNPVFVYEDRVVVIDASARALDSARGE